MHSSPGSSPFSPSRPSIKRPRRGSKLNLNATTLDFAKGATLPENDPSIAPVAARQGKTKNKSKSMIAKERLNTAAEKGTLVKDTKRWDAYIKRLEELDQHVEVFPDDPKKIRMARCSSCSKVIKQSEPYNTQRFKQHISRCKGKGTKLHAQSITGMLTFSINRPRPTTPLVERPCSGLTATHDGRIPQYTSRTEVRYAGGQSRVNLALKHFGQTYSSLSKEQKGEIDLHYRSGCQWELDHDDGRVFLCKCLQVVLCKDDMQTLPVCSECLSILTLHEFQVAISRKGAVDENRKYIPFQYQSVVTGKMYATNIGLGQFVQEVCTPAPIFVGLRR